MQLYADHGKSSDPEDIEKLIKVFFVVYYCNVAVCRGCGYFSASWSVVVVFDMLLGYESW